MLVYFPWLHQKNRVLTSRTLEYDKLDKLREWVISQNPSKDKSTHWWYSKLPTDICLIFSKIAMSDTIIKMFKDNLNETHIDILNDMNEIILNVKVSEPCLLIIANSYNQNWIASVNTENVPVYPVNYNFQGIPLTQGFNEVILKYQAIPDRLYREINKYLSET